jgi:hypothetical protein
MPPRTADRFRVAIRRGAHQDAEMLLDELRYEVETLWTATSSRAERQAIASEVTTLLEWARQMVVTSRSHAQAKLVGLDRPQAYLTSGSRRLEHVQIDG